MRYAVIFLLTTMVFVGCQTMDGFDKETNVYALDFRPYSEKGFLFTTESYSGEYNAIGLFSITQTPEMKIKTQKNYMSETFTKEAGTISFDETLDSLYSVAVNWGADAIINLKIDFSETYKNGELVDENTIRGFAIKRIK
jgi:hypothetical protein